MAKQVEDSRYTRIVGLKKRSAVLAQNHEADEEAKKAQQRLRNQHMFAQVAAAHKPVALFCAEGEHAKCSREGGGVVYTAAGKKVCMCDCHSPLVP